MRGILKYASWAVLVVAGVTFVALLRALMLKCMYNDDLPQDEVKLIKATARVWRPRRMKEIGAEVIMWRGNTFCNLWPNEGRVGESMRSFF
jgi:hypothetical protein